MRGQVMLGDYLNYNARPVDWSAPPKEKEKSFEVPQNTVKKTKVPDYASVNDEEGGYDPYNHPIDRKIIERHLEKESI